MINIQNIIKSDSDKREYKYFELNNKLKVLLIKDKLSMSCGALLNINVGSAHDTLPGMAHFLEHMVFMGSSKYPNVNNFMESVFKSGGVTNAMTGDTHTTYYFTIETDKYLENLDMFAYFFINPLLRKDNIEKEVNAVNAESIKNTSDDNWIFQEMIKKTMVEDHPVNHYTCGNNDTLKGDDLDIKVREFYEKYYSSNIMQLSLFINDKIDENKFINYINDTFGKIKNNNLIIDKNFGKILIPNNIIKYIPNLQIDSLTICTEIPKNFDSEKTSSLDLLSWILTSKTENSLFKILEDKGLLTDIDCAELYLFDDNILYITDFTLTKKGMKNYSDIIEIYYLYIKSIIKSNNIKDIYGDLLKKYHREYNLKFNDDIIDTFLKINMLINKNINIEDINTWMLNKPNYELIIDKFIDILNNIKPYNSSYILRSKKIKEELFKIDNIYKTKYNLNKIEPIYNLDINKKYYNLIKRNRFISDNVEIISGQDNFPNKNPEKIEKKYNLVYNFNSSYNIPDVNFYINLYCPLIMDSPEIYIKSILYIDSLYSDNSNLINEIEKAGYKFDIVLENDTFIIYIKSDNNNCDKIIDVLKNIFSFNNISKGFDSIKEKAYKKYKGYKNEKPLTKITSIMNKILLKKYYTPYELLDYINDATFEDCRNKFLYILDECITSMLISGNIIKQNAEKYAETIYNNLNIKKENKITLDLDTNLKYLKLPYIKKYINKNKDEKNNLFTLSYILFTLKKTDNECLKNIAFLNVLNAITNMQYFNKLRTNEQYGYIVTTKISYIGNHNNNVKTGTLKFIVQSPNKDSDFLLERTMNFIKNELNDFIINMSDEQYNDYINGEINNLSDIYHNLSEIDIFLCSQIFDFSYIYDYKEKVIKYIKDMSKDNFIKKFISLILNNKSYFSINLDTSQ